MFEFSRSERRVLANSDSGMQRFESCRPSQPVPSRCAISGLPKRKSRRLGRPDGIPQFSADAGPGGHKGGAPAEQSLNHPADGSFIAVGLLVARASKTEQLYTTGEDEMTSSPLAICSTCSASREDNFANEPSWRHCGNGRQLVQRNSSYLGSGRI
jgi:hypothetical protein